LYPGIQKQFPVLLLERGLAVMLFLSLDVTDQAIQIVLAAGEGAVSLLPVRELVEHGVFLNPKRRAGLDVFDEIGQADGGVQAAEDVKMILHAVDTIKMAVPLLDDAPDVAEEVLPAVALEDRRPVSRREDDVIGNGSSP
jgi:hypothetical protein